MTYLTYSAESNNISEENIKNLVSNQKNEDAINALNNFESDIERVLDEIFELKMSLLKKKENLKKLNYQNSWINVNQKIIKTINEN